MGLQRFRNAAVAGATVGALALLALSTEGGPSAPATASDVSASPAPLPRPSASVLLAPVTDRSMLAQELCSAIPAAYAVTPEDPKLAAELMAGSVTVGTYPPVQLRAVPDWSALPESEGANWRSRLQYLDWVDVLRREYERTGNLELLDRYVDILRSYTEANADPARAADRFAWQDRTTGRRTSTLVCAVGAIGLEPWLERALRLHVLELSDPANYKGKSNHALAQDVGLIAAARILGDGSALQLGEDRSLALLREAYDEQGVNNEESYNYWRHNIAWWDEMDRTWTAAQLPVPQEIEWLHRAPQFLADATLPTGIAVSFGDVSVGLPADAGLPPPSAPLAVYERGWLFSRSPTDGPLEDQSMLALRFGPPVADVPHGHEDAGSVDFWAHDTFALSQSGAYSYGGGAMRRWILSQEASNVLSAYEPGSVEPLPYDTTVETPLVTSIDAGGHHLATLHLDTIPGVSWDRTVVHGLAGHWLLVWDRATADRALDWSQHWNVARGGAYTVTGDRADQRVTADASGAVSVVTWGAEKLAVVSGLRKSVDGRRAGWRSFRYGAIEPAPTVEVRRSDAATFEVLTLVAVRDAGADPSTVQLEVGRDGDALLVTVTAGGITERLRIAADAVDAVG